MGASIYGTGKDEPVVTDSFFFNGYAGKKIYESHYTDTYGFAGITREYKYDATIDRDQVGPNGEVSLFYDIASISDVRITRIVMELGLYILTNVGMPIPHVEHKIIDVKTSLNHGDVTSDFLENLWTGVEHPGAPFYVDIVSAYIEKEDGSHEIYVSNDWGIDREECQERMAGAYPLSMGWVVPGHIENIMVAQYDPSKKANYYIAPGPNADGTWDIEAGISNPTNKKYTRIEFIFAVGDGYDANSQVFIPNARCVFDQVVMPGDTVTMRAKSVIPKLDKKVKLRVVKATVTFEDGTSASWPDDYKTAEGAKGGCYVATAVYGSYDCPQVWTLRRFRDSELAKTWYGRAFIHTYYTVSPTIVRWFGNKEWFNKLWKPKLDYLVEKLWNEGYECTPYQDQDWK